MASSLVQILLYSFDFYFYLYSHKFQINQTCEQIVLENFLGIYECIKNIPSKSGLSSIIFAVRRIKKNEQDFLSTKNIQPSSKFQESQASQLIQYFNANQTYTHYYQYIPLKYSLFSEIQNRNQDQKNFQASNKEDLTGKHFALKISKNIKRANKEVQLLYQFSQNPFIIHQFEHKISQDKTYILQILELVQNDLLSHILETDYKTAEDQQKMLEIFYKIVQGVEQIHQKGFVHCDLKPDNVLLTPTFDPKIIDFQFAIKRGEKGNFKGTLPFMDPDLVYQMRASGTGKYQFCFENDVFSLGALLYSWVTKFYPFGNTEEEIFDKYFIEKKFKLFQGTLLQIAQIIEGCFQKERANRLKLKEILALVEAGIRQKEKIVLKEDSDFLINSYLIENNLDNLFGKVKRGWFWNR